MDHARRNMTKNKMLENELNKQRDYLSKEEKKLCSKLTDEVSKLDNDIKKLHDLNSGTGKKKFIHIMEVFDSQQKLRHYEEKTPRCVIQARMIMEDMKKNKAKISGAELLEQIERKKGKCRCSPTSVANSRVAVLNNETQSFPKKLQVEFPPEILLTLNDRSIGKPETTRQQKSVHEEGKSFTMLESTGDVLKFPPITKRRMSTGDVHQLNKPKFLEASLISDVIQMTERRKSIDPHALVSSTQSTIEHSKPCMPHRRHSMIPNIADFSGSEKKTRGIPGNYEKRHQMRRNYSFLIMKQLQQNMERLPTQTLLDIERLRTGAEY